MIKTQNSVIKIQLLIIITDLQSDLINMLYAHYFEKFNFFIKITVT